MSNNEPPDLKKKEIAFNQNRIQHLNLLSDKGNM